MGLFANDPPPRSPSSNLSANLPARSLPGEEFIARGSSASESTSRSRRWLAQATFGFARRSPELSARYGLKSWQAVLLGVLFGLALGGFLVAPGETVACLSAAVTVPFIGVVLVRLVALIEMLRTSRTVGADQRLPDELLPSYTVLVPMFDEAAVLPRLIDSLATLDYPPGRLQILLVLEQVDGSTLAALGALTLPRHMRVIVVPDGQPRTKPKAANYALFAATGDFVVVYDAEDRPEADQLRRAAAAFAAGSPELACVQARLNIFNPRDSWLSRQFTVEYSALFDAMLPALARLGLPVPLGGTSNHFRRQTLESLGAWDPFNVTEDADLGVRLARCGYSTEVLASTTWEEAPVSFSQWLPQRTRWLKGWYQTYAVHTRRPWRLLRELGFARTLGFHVFLGGLLLSTLVHPLFYLAVAWNLAAPAHLRAPDLFASHSLWLVSGGTLAAGYAVNIAISVLAVRRRGHALLAAALQSPLTWLLISLASYRALWQLWTKPFLWEKTAHGRGRRRRNGSKAGDR